MPLGAARIALLAKTQVVAAAEVIRKKVGVSAVGNTQVDTAQSYFGGASVYFDGVNDYLQMVSSGQFAYGTDDFTIEFWIRPSGVSGIQVFYDGRPASGTYVTPAIYSDGTTLYYYTDGAVKITATSAVSSGTWQHIAVSRSSGSTKLFVDGTQVGSTYSDSNNYIDHDPYLGIYRPNLTGEYTGHMDEVRISDTARYTTTFTPSTTPFVNDDNTLILLHMDGTDASTHFEDDNGTGRAAVGVSALGDAQVDTAQYKFGGASLYATQDGLIAESVPNLDGDFTIEGWMRRDVTTSGDHLFTVASSPKLRLAANSGTSSMLLTYNDGNNVDSSISVTQNATTWYHYAVVRSSSVIKVYVDGTQVGTTYSDSIDYSGEDFYIGSDGTPGGTGDLTGHIDEFRVSDTARYTSGFTAPTAPFVNDSNTLLLLHMDGTDASTLFLDDNGVSRSRVGVTALGNAQTDTAQSNFGGSSALFDGTGDYLALNSQTAGPALIPETSEFTAELWVRLDVNNATQALMHQYAYLGGSSSLNGRFSWYVNTSGQVVLFIGGTGTFTLTGSTTLSTGTWHHLAVTRDSSNRFDIWVNGTSEDNTTSSISIQQSAYTAIASASHSPGFYLDGYIDELRVSNTARYTAAFTAPTEPFQNDANTLLLLHMDGTDGDTDFVDDNGKESA